jgi:glutathione S-transferase
MSTEPLTLYYAPKTRAFGALVLLEELGCPYRLHVLDMKAGEQRAAAYLAINPMGKVPALKHGDAVVTEQAAVYMYAADLYPAAKLAPALDDPRRGPYLRWMVFLRLVLRARADGSRPRSARRRRLRPRRTATTTRCSPR